MPSRDKNKSRLSLRIGSGSQQLSCLLAFEARCHGRRRSESSPIEHVPSRPSRRGFSRFTRHIERFQCAERREPHTINGSARYLFVEWRREEKKGRKHPMPASYALKMQIKRFDRAIAECKFLAKHKTMAMAMAMAIFLPRSASPACRRTNA